MIEEESSQIIFLQNYAVISNTCSRNYVNSSKNNQTKFQEEPLFIVSASAYGWLCVAQHQYSQLLHLIKKYHRQLDDNAIERS